MRKRAGFLGALSAIAMGVVAASTPAAHAQTAALTEVPQVDITVLCREILATTTKKQFLGIANAVAALNDEANACHQVALVQWLRLNDPSATGAISQAANNTGYAFL